MSVELLVAAVTLAALSGVPGLLLGARGKAGERLAVALLLAASACGVASALLAVFGEAGVPSVELPWRVPGGALALANDPISAVFLIQIFVIAPLGAVYGLEYWR